MQRLVPFVIATCHGYECLIFITGLTRVLVRVTSFSSVVRNDSIANCEFSESLGAHVEVAIVRG